MSVRNLESLFRPASVALIGASPSPGKVGAVVLRNLVHAGFSGPIWPVNPKYETIQGLRAYATVADLPAAPELAVICTPPVTIPGLIAQLGERGTRAAIVLTAGLAGMPGPDGRSLREAMLAAACPYLLRVLGPNCVGLLVPGIGLNASFAHVDALTGNIAFVSQSGALVTALLDQARSRGVGFSKFVSMGEGADVDFGDVLDYLANDADTRAILLYVEAITAARKFMSAARAAARNKPVLIVKAGRAPEGARAAGSHTGALAGADDVYDAAIRRAGMLRVYSTEDLFDAVETLARARPLVGERLAILTNGGGPGVLAADALSLAGGTLAPLEADTMAALDAALPAIWSRGNPVDIIGDAPATRYVDGMQTLLRDAGTDAVLLIHAPTAIVPSADIAAALVPVARGAARPVLGCWLGGDAVAQARAAFADAGIPTYETPEQAVRAFMQLVRYHRNQALLMRVPPAAALPQAVDREAAAAILRAALADGRTTLTEPEAKDVLAAYGVPVVATRIARTVGEAVDAAEALGYPVALKVLSTQVTHKSDIGGVVLDLESADAVRAAAEAIERRLRTHRPDARLDGFTVQRMARRPGAHELLVGVATDVVFGPVVVFGQGGTAVEVVADRAIGLPPLDAMLARDLVDGTRVAKLLAGYRNRPAVRMEAVVRVIEQVSQLAVDHPEIVELDVNPLLADERGVLALDARVMVAPTRSGGIDRLAILPYPAQLEETVDWRGQALTLRPMRPQDAPQHAAFFAALGAEDIHSRVFMPMRSLQPAQLARLTQTDYDREMAFIATRATDPAGCETLGVARAVIDPDNDSAEFAVIVRSDMKGLGLGALLMKKLIGYCRARGTRRMIGTTLFHNTALLALARRLGFEARTDDPELVELRLDLQGGSGESGAAAT